MIHSFCIPAEYLSHDGDFDLLNVAIYNHQVVYGLSSGIFVTYCLLEKRTVKVMSLKERRRAFRWHVANGRYEIMDPPLPEVEPSTASSLEVGRLPEQDARNPEIIDGTNAQNLPVPGANAELSNDRSHILNRTLPDFHIPMTINAPLTLILTSHFLVTNGCDPSSLAIWDLSTGQMITELSISNCFEDRSTPSINFCELSNDRTCLFACTDNDELLIWNFLTRRVVEASGQSRKRTIDQVELHDGMKVWIGTDFYR